MLGCSSSHNDQVDFSLFGHPGFVENQESMDRVMHKYLREEFNELLSSVTKVLEPASECESTSVC